MRPSTGSTSTAAPSGMRRRGAGRADDRRERELAGDDRGVAHRPAGVDDERAEDRQDRVVRRAGERRDEHVAGFEPVERVVGARRDAGDAAVAGVADAGAGQMPSADSSAASPSASRTAMNAAVARAIAGGSASIGGGGSRVTERVRARRGLDAITVARRGPRPRPRSGRCRRRSSGPSSSGVSSTTCSGVVRAGRRATRRRPASSSARRSEPARPVPAHAGAVVALAHAVARFGEQLVEQRAVVRRGPCARAGRRRAPARRAGVHRSRRGARASCRFGRSASVGLSMSSLVTRRHACSSNQASTAAAASGPSARTARSNRVRFAGIGDRLGDRRERAPRSRSSPASCPRSSAVASASAMPQRRQWARKSPAGMRSPPWVSKLRRACVPKCASSGVTCSTSASSSSAARSTRWNARFVATTVGAVVVEPVVDLVRASAARCHARAAVRFRRRSSGWTRAPTFMIHDRRRRLRLVALPDADRAQVEAAVHELGADPLERQAVPSASEHPSSRLLAHRACRARTATAAAGPGGWRRAPSSRARAPRRSPARRSWRGRYWRETSLVKIYFSRHDRISPSPYSSPLRDSQAQRTRDLILDALTELLSERTGRRDHHPRDRRARRRVAADRVPALPDRRRCSKGSPTGSTRSSTPRAATASPRVTRRPRGAVAARASRSPSSTPSRRPPKRSSTPTRAGSRARAAPAPTSCAALVADSFPEYDERDHLRITALLRNLYSVQTWLRMREEFGIPGAESGPIVAWAIQTLVNEIRAGNFPRSELDG